MTSTATYYMERPATMPMAAPVGAVADFGFGDACSSPSARHRADSATTRGNPVKMWTTGIERQAGLTTSRFTRHLGSSST